MKRTLTIGAIASSIALGLAGTTFAQAPATVPQKAQSRLSAMVAAGTITQAQADAQVQWHKDLEQWFKDHPAPLKDVLKGKGMMGFGARGFARHHQGFGMGRMMR